MILYSIVPPELVFQNFEQENCQRVIDRNGILLLVTDEGTGWGKILRIISTNPADFLNEQYQPGKKIFLGG